MISHMRYALRLCLFCFFVTVTTPFVHAQLSGSGLSGVRNDVQLRVTPQYYEPNTEVTINLNDYSINTNGATIQWFVDGREMTDARNQRSLTTLVGELGETSNVRTLITLPNGSRVPAATTLQPIRVDLLVEADTLTPAFYRGRSLPSSGSLVRVTAIPFTGTATPPEQFSYTWEVGRDVISGGSQIGQNTVTFSPKFSMSVPVQVTVFDSNGVRLTSRSVTVPIRKPELHFYEVNPLRGLQTNALSQNQVFQGNEMQIRAEPYYINRIQDMNDFHIEWKLNGRTVTNDADDPQQITLRRQGTSGNAQLNFHIRNLNDLLQGVEDDISLRF